MTNTQATLPFLGSTVSLGPLTAAAPQRSPTVPSLCGSRNPRGTINVLGLSLKANVSGNEHYKLSWKPKQFHPPLHWWQTLIKPNLAKIRHMGGKKKPTISQLVKREAREKEQVEKKGKGKGKAAEEAVKKVVATVPAELYDQITKDIKGMDYVTTYIISSKYGLKMGAATRVLNDLVRKGELVLVSKGRRMNVYAPVERARKLGLI